MEKSEFKEADTLYKKANEIYIQESLLPTSERNTDEFAMLLQNWGKNKSQMNCNLEAMRDFEKSLEIIGQEYPPSSKYTYKAHSNLAQIFYQLYYYKLRKYM